MNWRLLAPGEKLQEGDIGTMFEIESIEHNGVKWNKDFHVDVVFNRGFWYRQQQKKEQMKYRKMQEGEVIQAGDVGWCCNEEPDLENEIGLPVNERDAIIGRTVGFCSNLYWRPIKHNWVSFEERKPTRQDAGYDGQVLNRCNDGSIGLFPWSASIYGNETHWMPLFFTPETPTRVRVYDHDVIPNKDGTVKVGCQKISKESMDEIIRQRQAAMK